MAVRANLLFNLGVTKLKDDFLRWTLFDFTLQAETVTGIFNIVLVCWCLLGFLKILFLTLILSQSRQEEFDSN